MLTVEKYLSYVFEVVQINAALEEIRRFKPALPLNAVLQQREDVLYAKRDKIMRILDKEHKPVEIAPYEQYIDIEMQFDTRP